MLAEPLISAKEFELLLSSLNHNLKSAAEYAYQYFSESFSGSLRNCSEALKLAARSTDDVNEKGQYIEAMEIVQRHQSELAEEFQQALLHHFQALKSPALFNQATSSSLQDGIASKNRILCQKLIADAQRHFEQGIDQSTAALKNALEAPNIDLHNNPFAPNLVIESCFQALQSQAFSEAALFCLLNHFQQSWFVKQKAFYIKLSEHFKQAGVKLQGGSSINTNQKSSNADHGFKLDTVETEAFDEPALFDDSANSQQAELTDAISLIQSASIPPNIQITSYQPMALSQLKNPLPLSAHAIVQLIQDMQKGYEPGTDGDVIRYIKKQLELQSNANQTLMISLPDENTINLISLTFRVVASQLSEELGNLFLRLKPVYAQLALSDDFFFHDNLHPARKLFDALFALANSRLSDQAITRYIKTVIMKVQLKFKQDNNLFEELLTDIRSYITAEKERSEENHKALIEHFSQQENQSLANDACAKLLKDKLNELDSTIEFIAYFEKILSPVLAKVYLNHGSKSEQWKDITAKVSFIINMLKETNIQTLRKNAKLLAAANAEMAQYLSEYKVKIGDKQTFLEQLQDIQIQQMQGKKLSELYDSALKHHKAIHSYLHEQHVQPYQNEDLSFIGHQHQQLKTARFAMLKSGCSDNEALQLVKQLSIGTWINILIEQKSVAAQYGFYSRARGIYIFFDRDHNKLFERDELSLCKDFESGFACLLEQTANFDGALEQVSRELARIGIH